MFIHAAMLFVMCIGGKTYLICLSTFFDSTYHTFYAVSWQSFSFPQIGLQNHMILALQCPEVVEGNARSLTDTKAESRLPRQAPGRKGQ